VKDRVKGMDKGMVLRKVKEIAKWKG